MTEFSIYQINVDRDTANVCFIGMESLEKIKGTKEVNAAAYDRVYDGKMDCISLENIYQKFNVDHPADYKGRSLSVSDVVDSDFFVTGNIGSLEEKLSCKLEGEMEERHYDLSPYNWDYIASQVDSVYRLAKKPR